MSVLKELPGVLIAATTLLAHTTAAAIVVFASTWMESLVMTSTSAKKWQICVKTVITTSVAILAAVTLDSGPTLHGKLFLIKICIN